MSDISLARMTPAAASMAERIPVGLRSGQLEHTYTSMGDNGLGVFGFSDDGASFDVYSDGTVETVTHAAYEARYAPTVADLYALQVEQMRAEDDAYLDNGLADDRAPDGAARWHDGHDTESFTSHTTKGMRGTVFVTVDARWHDDAESKRQTTDARFDTPAQARAFAMRWKKSSHYRDVVVSFYCPED